MNNLKINHLAVLVCVILLHVIGFLWYGPLFGEKWMAMVNLDLTEAESGSMEAGLWITNLIASVAAVYLLAWILKELRITSGARGAVIAFLITFCIFHLSEMRGNMFAGFPYGLAWITGGFNLVGNTLSGFILGSWIKRDAAVR
jgi:hypothetical protein